jgi:hypothetical protein
MMNFNNLPIKQPTVYSRTGNRGKCAQEYNCNAYPFMQIEPAVNSLPIPLLLNRPAMASLPLPRKYVVRLPKVAPADTMTTVGNNGKPRAGRPATTGSRNIGSRMLAIRDNKNIPK